MDIVKKWLVRGFKFGIITTLAITAIYFILQVLGITYGIDALIGKLTLANC